MNPDVPHIGLFDLDGSLADYESGLRRYLNLLHGPTEPELTADLWESEKMDHIAERMKLIKALPGFWRRLEPIGEGFAIVQTARRIGYELHVLTKGPRAHPTAWAEKLEWCQQYLPDMHVHITMDKGLVYGTFLYDDFPLYMSRWLEHRPRGLGIMPVTGTNQEFRHPRVVNWDGTNADEVREALQIAFDRVPGTPLVLPWKGGE